MKKKLLSALTTALILGAASTTFAAEIDDQVQELRGRVADLERARSYDRSRIADLEYELDARNSQPSVWDKFKVNGELRYRFWGLRKAEDVSSLQLRILPSIQVNDNFAIKARVTGSYNLKNDTRARGNNLEMNFAYLEGKFDNFQINAGKMPLFTNVDSGLVADDFFSGLQFITSADAFKLYVNGGHWSGVGADYIGAEAAFDANEDLNFGAGFHYFKKGDNKAHIVTGGANYQVNEDWSANAAIAHNNKASSHKTAYNLEADYLGAKRNVVGSWGAFAAYRYVGGQVGIAPTYDSFGQTSDKKGFDIGATYTPYRDTLVKLSYFQGKGLTSKSTDRTIFARASLFF